MNSLETTFTTFYEGWFNRHHDLQQQLTTDNERQFRKLVEQASQHYHEYYQEKLTLIEGDAMAMVQESLAVAKTLTPNVHILLDILHTDSVRSPV